MHFGVSFPFFGALRALDMKKPPGVIRDLGYFWVSFELPERRILVREVFFCFSSYLVNFEDPRLF